MKKHSASNFWNIMYRNTIFYHAFQYLKDTSQLYIIFALFVELQPHMFLLSLAWQKHGSTRQMSLCMISLIQSDWYDQISWILRWCFSILYQMYLIILSSPKWVWSYLACMDLWTQILLCLPRNVMIFWASSRLCPVIDCLMQYQLH